MVLAHHRGELRSVIHNHLHKVIISHSGIFASKIFKGVCIFMLTRRKDGRFLKTKTINGKKIFFYSSEPTEKRAEKDITKQMIEYAAKESIGKKLLKVCDEWEEHHYKNVKAQTEERYKSYVKRFNNFFEDEYIKKIEAADIERFLQSMVFEQLSTKTIRDQFSIVKQIMRYSVIKKYITTDPTQYITPPKGKPKVVREALTEEDVKKIKSDRFSDFGKIAFFLLYTGLRKGELLALTYGDIDYNNSTIHITKSVEYIGNKPNLSTTKTQAGVRTVPLPDIIKPIVKIGKHKKPDIIFNENGGYMHKSYFREHWVKHCEKIGINVTPHQLRHTYATMLYEWNISEKDAQTIMGHSDISITHNIYTHVRESHMTNTIENINERIAKESL